MNSPLHRRSSTPLGSQVCRASTMLQTWDSKGVQQLLTSKELETEIMKNLEGLQL